MALSIIYCKMSSIIFDLVYSDYDWQEHHFIQAPEGTTLEDFQNLCDHLMPKAGYKATLKRSSPKVGGWICWSDVVESLVSLLEKQGYQRIILGSYVVNGGVIVRPEESKNKDKLGFSYQAIASYNGKLERKLAEERKAKKLLRIGVLKKKMVQIIK